VKDRKEIKKIGGYVEKDKDGYLINPASPEKIQGKWGAALDALLQGFIKEIGESLHSVYIRGSVAKGEAIDGVSDLDTVVVVDGPVTEEPPSWLKPLKKRILTEFTFVIMIDTEFASLAERDWYLDILIKVQGLCIYGDDLSETIEPYKLDKSLIINTRYIKGDIEWLLGRIKKQNITSEYLKSRCKWIAKIIVRAGCELVLLRSGKYSRDLYPCYEIFSKYYPEKKQDMYKALELAINPVSDTKQVKTMLQSIGTWLVGEATKTFGAPFLTDPDYYDRSLY